jgi:hypothetical protein
MLAGGGSTCTGGSTNACMGILPAIRGTQVSRECGGTCGTSNLGSTALVSSGGTIYRGKHRWKHMYCRDACAVLAVQYTLYASSSYVVCGGTCTIPLGAYIHGIREVGGVLADTQVSRECGEPVELWN